MGCGELEEQLPELTVSSSSTADHSGSLSADRNRRWSEGLERGTFGKARTFINSSKMNND